MRKVLQYIFPFELPQGFQSDELGRRYEEWDRPARQTQIAAISALTALLYIIFTLLDKSWVSEPVQALMERLYLFINVPMLLTISWLAYKKRYYRIVMPALAVSPLIAVACHVYVTRELAGYTPLLVEGYLVVLWIFVVSGMTFSYALASAIVTSAMLLVAGNHNISDPSMYATHAFWIFCSFSFGFLGSLIYDRSRKAIFTSQQELHRMAITDELTGAFNRNHFNQVISQEISRDRRYEKSCGLLMIDIDHFKAINDSYGHAVGDEVLRKVAQVLSQSLRANDTLIRWGGEEFVVVAIELDEESLEPLCEKLRQGIEVESFAPVGAVTVSIGATLYRDGDTQDALLSRADTALYEAKESGRNRTVVAARD